MSPRRAIIGCTGAWLLAVATTMHAVELPTFAITLNSGSIEPPRLEVPANTKVKLTLRNTGRGAVEFEGRDVRVEKVLAPGAESFVVLPPMKSGTYRFFDEFHPDAKDMLVIVK
jgi:heme/copper-type cytochrome/quinol oxidase subunit 2